MLFLRLNSRRNFIPQFIGIPNLGGVLVGRELNSLDKTINNVIQQCKMCVRECTIIIQYNDQHNKRCVHVCVCSVNQ